MNALEQQVERALAGFVASGHVVVAVPDRTRPIDYTATLRPLLVALKDAEVTIVVALGLHRRMDAAEMEELAQLAEEHHAALRQHDPDEGLEGNDGVSFPRFIRGADLLISVGVVEPHQYAGFSGGAKAFAIGCAGRDSIQQMHSLPMLKSLGAAVGRHLDNPFQSELWRRVGSLPPLFSLLVIPGGEASVVFGKGRAIHEMACELAHSTHFRPTAQVDWMVLNVPASKSASFYQASRAATYAALVENPAIRLGGALLLCADCPEGMGIGSGEEAFVAALAKGADALNRELRQDPPPTIPGGAQRAYVLAQAMERARIALIRSQPLAELDTFGLPTYASIEEAQIAMALTGEGLVVDAPFHQVPVSG